MGAFFLLWNDRAADAVHGPTAAAPGSRRARARARTAPPSVRDPRTDVEPRFRIADLRLVRRPGLFHAAIRRNDCRSLAGHANDRGPRRVADERGPHRHVVRPELPVRAGAADPRVGMPYGQYLGAGRPALSARRGIAADAGL